MAKKTKEPTSRGVVKNILAKAWNAVRGKPRSERGTKAEVEAKAIKKIAEKTGRSEKQIRDIEKGKRPGRNLLDSLKGIFRGRKVKAPPKEEKKITRQKEKPEKPPKEKPPKKEPEKPPALPAMPNGLKVKVKGEMAPFENDDYLTMKWAYATLHGDALARFLDLWTSGEEEEALGMVIAIYYGHVPEEQQSKAGEVYIGYMPGLPEDWTFTDPVTNEPIDI